MTSNNDNPWSGSYKIPWNDPDFSRRMLAEHLSQNHDMASRRTEWIDRQTSWIHRELLNGRTAGVVDLGCGPGLYSHRLTTLGHRCLGIDFGPAAIEYAKRHNPDPSRCDFLLDDIRHAAFGGPHDLAMILFGELNVFSPDEAFAILNKARAALGQAGTLMVEVQTPEAVERAGRSEPVEQQLQCGLFSDRPHRLTVESRWLPEHQVAVQTFSVAETGGGRERVYRSTTKAWSDDHLTELLRAAGLAETARRPDWPCNTDSLALWIATRR